MNQDSIANRSGPTVGHRPWYITAVRVVRRFVTHQPLGTLGIVIFAALAFLAIFAPLLAPVDPQKPDRKAIFADYSDYGETGYLLGGDQQGRDLLSRLIYGARISLYVSVVATIAGVSIGTALGVISATSGGKVDLVIQRFIDAMMAFPSLILALAIRATLGASLENVILAIAITVIAPTTRAIRSQALSIVPMDYVTAARAVGAGYWRIAIRHVLPQCLSLSMILVSVTLGAAIIIESSLSFLGLGPPPHVPSWGGIMGGSTYEFLRKQPQLVYLPSIAIGLAVFAFNMMGDALRDLWDPRMRGSRN